MFRWVKKIHLGSKVKVLCPVCNKNSFFYQKYSYAGMAATDTMGPTGYIGCASCKISILILPASVNLQFKQEKLGELIKTPEGELFYPPKDVIMTSIQAGRITKKSLSGHPLFWPN